MCHHLMTNCHFNVIPLCHNEHPILYIVMDKIPRFATSRNWEFCVRKTTFSCIVSITICPIYCHAQTGHYCHKNDSSTDETEQTGDEKA
jgi:hypothetical protein